MSCTPVWGASGVQGFFGEGYPYHGLLKLLFPGKFSFKNVTLVSKTTTLKLRKGNMPLRKDGITPKKLLPKCITVRPFKGVALNAVGLSGPGAQTLFDDGRWQNYEEPLFISFMSVESDPEIRFAELEEFLTLFARYQYSFKKTPGIQINLSCPNVGLKPEKLVSEARRGLDKVALLVSRRIPTVLKFNALLPIEAAREIESHGRCDGLCMSNTIPWGMLPEQIDWQGLFGSNTSPLEKFGGGGLSGTPLLPIVRNWVEKARNSGITKHINAGGGILCGEDARELFSAGASSIFIGSVVMLRPWRLQQIVRTALLAAP